MTQWSAMKAFRFLTRLASGIISVIVHPAVVGLTSVVGLAALYAAENQWVTVPFAAALLFSAAALVFTVTGRLAFSIYSAIFAVGTITLVSAIKFKQKGFSLHFYDIVFAGNDPEVFRFLITDYGHLIMPVVILAITAAAMLALLFRAEKKRFDGWLVRLLPFVLCTGLLPATYPAEASVEQRYFYYMHGRHTSAFFVSLLDLSFVFDTGELEKRLANYPMQPPFTDTVDCGTGPLPDIYLVLGESQTDPSIFPQLANGQEIADEMFAVGGKARPLSVETFGGGTWVTNLSLMAGLSATDFGWRSPYLTIELEGKVKGALPDVLARCGYRTAAILPMKYSFVNEGPFLSSIGFETVVDLDQLKAPTYHMRDKFYFDAAEKFVGEHRDADRRPLFLLVQTMFAHSPYEEQLEPDIATNGEPLSGDPQIAEYLRRLIISRQDFAEFATGVRTGDTARGSVLVSFGDHQAFVTKPFVDEISGSDALSTPNSLAYRTFYTIEGGIADRQYDDQTNAAPDIAFLGNHILGAAGIPGSPLYRDLARLEELCSGRFFACSDREAVDRHLRRRVDSGALNVGLPHQPAVN